MCLRTSELAAFDVCFHPVEIRKTFKLHLTIYVQGQLLVPVKEVVRSIYGEVESKGVKVDVVDVCAVLYFTSHHKKNVHLCFINCKLMNGTQHLVSSSHVWNPPLTL